jgi:hypothetical protein
MDEYLSRRIKNWGTWQRPDRDNRAQLLAMAASGASPYYYRPARFARLRGLIGAFLTLEAHERIPFQPHYLENSNLTLLTAELLWPVSPLRYA